MKNNLFLLILQELMDLIALFLIFFLRLQEKYSEQGTHIIFKRQGKTENSFKVNLDLMSCSFS